MGLGAAGGRGAARPRLVGLAPAQHLADGAGHLLPLWPGSADDGYAVLSPAHLADVANALLLAAPVPALLLPTLWIAGRDRGPAAPTGPDWFLASAAGGLLATLAVASPDIGALRDWDVLSVAGLPLTVWAGVALDRRAVEPRGAVLLLGAAALHLFLWVGVNADDGASTRRFAHWLERAERRPHARAYGAETLGRHRRDRGDDVGSLAAYRLAVEAAPGNPRLWRAAGYQALSMGDPAAAGGLFATALHLDSTSAAAWAGLGLARASTGDLAGGIVAQVRAVRLHPGDAQVLTNLCRTYNLAHRFGDAHATCAAALRVDPGHAEAHRQLVGTFLSLGQPQAARGHLLALRRLDPASAAQLDTLLAGALAAP